MVGCYDGQRLGGDDMFNVSSAGLVQFNAEVREMMLAPTPVSQGAMRGVQVAGGVLALVLCKKAPALQVAGMATYYLQMTGAITVALVSIGAKKSIKTALVAGNLALLMEKRKAPLGISSQLGIVELWEEVLTRGAKALGLKGEVEVEVLPEAGREEMLPEGMGWQEELGRQLDQMSLEELEADPFVQKVTKMFSTPPCSYCGSPAPVAFIESNPYCSTCIREGAAPDSYYEGSDVRRAE